MDLGRVCQQQGSKKGGGQGLSKLLPSYLNVWSILKPMLLFLGTSHYSSYGPQSNGQHEPLVVYKGQRECVGEKKKSLLSKLNVDFIHTIYYTPHTQTHTHITNLYLTIRNEL